MAKRWHKISELVDAREFTEMEIISACLDGKIPVYSPQGMQLSKVIIPCGDNFTLRFIYGLEQSTPDDKFAGDRLYLTYEDMKDFLISEQDKQDYLMGLPLNVDVRIVRAPYFIELAKHKLQALIDDASNSIMITNIALQADESKCNPKSKATLYKFILGLVDLYHINLAESGLATSLESATEKMGYKLSRSTAYALLAEIREYQRTHQP